MSILSSTKLRLPPNFKNKLDLAKQKVTSLTEVHEKLIVNAKNEGKMWDDIRSVLDMVTDLHVRLNTSHELGLTIPDLAGTPTTPEEKVSYARKSLYTIIAVSYLMDISLTAATTGAQEVFKAEAMSRKYTEMNTGETPIVRTAAEHALHMQALFSMPSDESMSGEHEDQREEYERAVNENEVEEIEGYGESDQSLAVATFEQSLF
jgi:hypothetical protein